jgi:cation transport ATPase
MSTRSPLSRPRWVIFRILAFGERRAKALQEYLEAQDEVGTARVDERDHKLMASLTSGTDPWEVESSAAAGGFPISESKAPLDSTPGRLDVVLLVLAVVATVLSFLGTYYNLLTGDAALLVGAFIVFICGFSIIRNAIVLLFEGKFGSELLLAMAVLAPLPFSYQSGTPFYYASGIVVLIAQAATMLNRYVEPRFQDLDFFLPTNALNEKGEWIETETAKAGDVLKVMPGFRVPADGTVSGGEGLALAPGTCVGSRLQEGSPVIGGSLIMEGTLLVKAARDKGESAMRKVARAFSEARKPIQVLLSYPKSIERALLLVTIMGVSFVYLFYGNMTASVAVLIAAAPAAALIARPLSLFAAYLGARKNGAGYTSHGSIERMSMTDVVIFDGLGSVADKAVLADTAGDAEVKAAVEAYTGDDPLFVDARGEVYSLVGLGDASKIDKVPEDLLSKARAFESKGLLARYAYKGSTLLGVAAFELSVPDDMKASVERLGKAGIKNVTLLSSETAALSESVAKRAGIPVVKSRMDDGERLDFIHKLGSDGKNVLAAGRGCELSRFAANAAAVTVKEPAVGFEGLEDAVCGSPSEVAGLVALAKGETKRASEGMSFGFYFNTLAIIAASTTLVDIELMLLMVAASVVAIATNSLRPYFARLK